MCVSSTPTQGHLLNPSSISVKPNVVKKLLFLLLIVVWACGAPREATRGGTIASRMNTRLTKTDRQWNAHLGQINFVDEAPSTLGSSIYHSLIPDADAYIRSVAREVMQTLYFSPDDSIPQCDVLDYILRDNPRCVSVFISAHMEQRVENLMQRKGYTAEEAEAAAKKRAEEEVKSKERIEREVQRKLDEHQRDVDKQAKKVQEEARKKMIEADKVAEREARQVQQEAEKRAREAEKKMKEEEAEARKKMKEEEAAEKAAEKERKAAEAEAKKQKEAKSE